MLLARRVRPVDARGAAGRLALLDYAADERQLLSAEGAHAGVDRFLSGDAVVGSYRRGDQPASDLDPVTGRQSGAVGQDDRRILFVPITARRPERREAIQGEASVLQRESAGEDRGRVCAVICRVRRQDHPALLVGVVCFWCRVRVSLSASRQQSAQEGGRAGSEKWDLPPFRRHDPAGHLSGAAFRTRGSMPVVFDEPKIAVGGGTGPRC